MGTGRNGGSALTIGVCVEGRSDLAFWETILHREFLGVRFDIKALKGRPKLVARAAELVDGFRSLHYPFSIILVDRNSDPCVRATVQAFDQEIIAAARTPLGKRNVFVCVAVAELESWYLADEEAIRHAIPAVPYCAPPETGLVGAERTIRRLWRGAGHEGPPGGGKLGLARAVAQRFDPERAKCHSASFAYFWDRVKTAIHAAS